MTAAAEPAPAPRTARPGGEMRQRRRSWRSGRQRQPPGGSAATQASARRRSGPMSVPAARARPDAGAIIGSASATRMTTVAGPVNRGSSRPSRPDRRRRAGRRNSVGPAGRAPRPGIIARRDPADRRGRNVRAGRPDRPRPARRCCPGPRHPAALLEQGSPIWCAIERAVSGMTRISPSAPAWTTVWLNRFHAGQWLSPVRAAGPGRAVQSPSSGK